jgi:FkbM family methyltransferase
MTIYDIGAQAGFYTLIFSQLVGKKGRVYAFEPCPYEARFLADHIRMNQLANVQILQLAVGERDGLVGMTINRGTCQNQVCRSSDSILTVPMLNLDGSGLPPPDLIKMDVEGAESSVLKGAQALLRETRPIVFVALHGAEQQTACTEILRACNYRIHDLAGQPLNGACAVDEIYALPV